MQIKVSDYIVKFFIEKGVSDVFGYPGGMVTHLMESFRQKEDEIKVHVNYHEQASAFCACGYAQIAGKPGVAYATSGPGATNLVTGICNAYFDSAPTFFITGQVNTFESKKGLQVRQRGFQETDIVSMVKGVTKYAAYIDSPEKIREELEKAWYIANEGRKGPVLLDIPMNIFRSVVETDELEGYYSTITSGDEEYVSTVSDLLSQASRPVLLVGAGVKSETARLLVKTFAEQYNVPTVTSMLAFDVLESSHRLNYGFIGAYGNRTANFIVAKCDLLIAVGTRLDVRQIGAQKDNFAPGATLIRIDIDEGELSNSIKQREYQIKTDAVSFFDNMLQNNNRIVKNADWLNVCNRIKQELEGKDDRKPNQLIAKISEHIPENTVITTDVGQNQVWIAQSFKVKKNQNVLFSGGHGAMGYSLPAAIGAYYASRRKVISFNGDGGFQMNLQELQFVTREQLPITIIVLNNQALGMIRHFQEMYFEDQYFQTVPEGGYTTPDFTKLAWAYSLNYYRIQEEQDIHKVNWNADTPQLVEVFLDEKTYVFPKLEFGKPNQDQEPLIERPLYERLMGL